MSVGTGDDFRERRRFPRIEARTRVNCVGKNIFSSDYSRNLCVGGMCIEGIYPISPGSQVNVQFSLPDSTQVITAKARVIWVKESGIGSSVSMGLEFLNLDLRFEESLQKYLFQKDSPQKGSSS